MITSLDCIPCFVRQTLDAARLITDDPAIHERLLRSVLADVSSMDLNISPPQMGQHIHRLIRQYTGDADPYKKIKDRFNRFALDLMPEMEMCVSKADDPFEAAMRLAIAGNIIDFGVKSTLDDAEVSTSIRDALTVPLVGDVDELRAAVDGARNILYIADNAGEIVFDKLLLARLPLDRVVLGVRGNPVINDATLEDAESVGITDMVRVISSGSDVPGTVYAECSEEFRVVYDQADVIIAKGQGNYETLSQARENIFFLLKAKCPVIADDIGCEVGRLVVARPVIRKDKP